MNHQAAHQLDDWKDFHLKHHLFHKITIFLQAVGNRIQHLAVKKPGHDARYQPGHIGSPRHWRRRPETRRSKDDCIDGNGHNGLDEHPYNPKIRPNEPFPEISLAQIPYQLSLLNDLPTKRQYIIHI